MSELKQEKTQEHKVSDLNPEDKKITNPLELVKMDFSEYLSKLSKDIPSKVSFGNPYIKNIPDNVNAPKLNKAIFYVANGTYLYNVYSKKGEKKIEIQKLINAIPKIVKYYHKIYNNKSVEPPEANIQLIFELETHEDSEPVILNDKAKSDYKIFNTALNKSNNRIIAKFDDTSFFMFRNELNKITPTTAFCFTNAGRVNYEDFVNGRLYSNGYIESDKIIPANDYGEIDTGNVYITLDKSKLAVLPELYLGDYNVKTELYKLLSQTEKIYKGRIEPFLCLGTAIMCIFLEEIWNELTGFPVVYLQGHTKQGKSLIQGIVANLFGYNKKYISNGNSTDNAIAMKCYCSNSIPVCINDYDYFKSQGNHFENNIVHFYEAGVREKMKNGIEFNLQPVSSTAIYSSNYLPAVKPKIFNRLLPLYFPDNGLEPTAITKDYVNDIKRSRILAEVHKFNWEKISNLIEETEKFILSFNIFKSKDRESNNIAIAYAGLSLLEYIADYKLPEQEKLLFEYCEWYQNLFTQSISPVDVFLNTLPNLYHKKLLKRNIHFKLELIEGRVIFAFNTQECIKIFNLYCMQDDVDIKPIDTKTFAQDLNASKYFIKRVNKSYQHKKQASSTILDITDSQNGKSFYYGVTGDTNAEFLNKLADNK